MKVLHLLSFFASSYSMATGSASLHRALLEDCAPDLSQFVSFAVSQFSGNSSLLTAAETEEVEGAFLASFNKRAEQVCDPFLRKLTGVRTVRVVVETEMPSSAPSSSSIPSDLPSLLPSLAPSSIPSDFPSLAPSEMPSFFLVRKRQNARQLQDDATLEATVNVNATGNLTEAPTQAPTTRGPDLFSFFFELTGQCNGCEADSNLFDDVAFRRRLTMSVSDVSHDVRGARFLDRDEESGKCACDEEAEDRGVRQDEFLETFSEAIEQKELPSVEAVVETKVLEEIPPTSEPTSSPLPSVPPTVSPGGDATPSAPAAPSPQTPSSSASPTGRPTGAQTGSPTFSSSSEPSVAPTHCFNVSIVIVALILSGSLLY